MSAYVMYVTYMRTDVHTDVQTYVRIYRHTSMCMLCVRTYAYMYAM